MGRPDFLCRYHGHSISAFRYSPLHDLGKLRKIEQKLGEFLFVLWHTKRSQLFYRVHTIIVSARLQWSNWKWSVISVDRTRRKATMRVWVDRDLSSSNRRGDWAGYTNRRVYRGINQTNLDNFTAGTVLVVSSDLQLVPGRWKQADIEESLVWAVFEGSRGCPKDLKNCFRDLKFVIDACEIPDRLL